MQIGSRLIQLIFHSSLFETTVWRITSWSPQSANDSDRLETICEVFSKHDVIVLNGTQQRRDRFRKIRQQKLPNGWTAISCGWDASPGKQSTRSCGITFLLSKKVSPHVKDVVEGIHSVAGRLAGVRIRSRQGDFFIVGCYFPVRIHPGADEYEQFQGQREAGSLKSAWQGFLHVADEFEYICLSGLHWSACAAIFEKLRC